MKKYNKQKSFGYDSNGKRIIKWFHADSKQDLERQIEQYRLQLQYTPNADNTTFGEYKVQWQNTYKRNRSKATQDMYKYALTHTENIDYLPLTKITKTKCQECVMEVWDRPRMASILASAMKQIFEAAVQDGMLYRNPAASLDLPKKAKAKFHLLTDRELKAVEDAHLCPEDRMLVTILRTFGLRPSEALALTVNDFDLHYNVLHITKSLELANDNKSQIKDTKTGVSRDIPIPVSLIPYLKSYFADLRGFLLFDDKDNHYLTKSQYNAISRRIKKAVNVAISGDDNINMIPGFTLYSFRHRRSTELYYLTQSADHPISLLQASKLMGNSINVFLNTYSHVMDDREDLQKIYLPSVTNL